MGKESKAGKKGFLSESEAIQILRRYSAVTVMGLLREVARCEKSKMDWEALVKKTSTGISSAREYQALWRHLAYRTELADFYEDGAEPSDEDSDLEFDLVPSPAVTAEASAEAVRWIKADLQRFDGSWKKKGDVQLKSRSKDAVVPSMGDQARMSGLPSCSVDASKKGVSAATIAGMNSNPASPPNGAQISSGAPDCPPGSISRLNSGQSERKKRKLWSPEEDQELIAAVEKFGEGNWTNILKDDFTHERTAAQLSQRWALIRKRREARASLNKPTPDTVSLGSSNGQESGSPPSSDILLPTNIVQTAGHDAEVKVELPPSPVVENGSVNQDVLSTPMELVETASATQSAEYISNLSNPPLGNTEVNDAVNASLPTSSSMTSRGLNDGAGQHVGTSNDKCQAQAAEAAWPTTAITTVALASIQVCNEGAKNKTAGDGAGRLLAPEVMSTAAVGGCEMSKTASIVVTEPEPCSPSSIQNQASGVIIKTETCPALDIKYPISIVDKSTTIVNNLTSIDKIPASILTNLTSVVVKTEACPPLNIDLQTSEVVTDTTTFTVASKSEDCPPSNVIIQNIFVVPKTETCSPQNIHPVSSPPTSAPK